MPALKQSAAFICTRCLRRQGGSLRAPNALRSFSGAAKLLSASNPRRATEDDSPGKSATTGTDAQRQDEALVEDAKELGAMARRLEEMTEDSLEQNPRRAAKMVEESGFSEELKAKLEARIAEGKFKDENVAALSVANMPAYAGKGAREQAAADPWTGTEKLEDAALRMLEDAHKPLKPIKGSKPRLPNLSVDTRMKRAVTQSPGRRLGSAREKASMYASTQDNRMSEAEKEEFRKTMRARFQPGARSVPATIQGLQSLASERIEDAISRGVFKNIPRGKGVNIERDHTASSPFLDTTEYFMNKIIQRQEVLPPWVEKQQEVTKQAATFRSRLRSEWRRHAARTIASKGGTLEQQVRRAEAYAKAEELVNPRKAKTELMTTIDGTGKLKHVTVKESPASKPSEGAEITVTESVSPAPQVPEGSEGEQSLQKVLHVETSGSTLDTASAAAPVSTTSEVPPAPHPFRDPQWEATELSYHTLALKSLNDTTRSYNLMAPELAKRPYFNLERELKACFADVAPLLPGEIRERARAPPKKAGFEVVSHRKGGVMEKFGGQKVRVYESTKPQYGFKEFWRDLFAKREI